MEKENEEMKVPECCRKKPKERSEKGYRDLVNRLSRIEGQVRGVKKMLDNNAYCVDVMTQVAAINAALNSFNRVLLEDHLRTCVTDDIRAGKDDKIEELVKLMQKLMK
ncbi:MAG: metal-sensing transcriptional repressor [Anaerovoracaceae bacterium]|jgi:DNA-binding FrmR family transcriptional regulator